MTTIKKKLPKGIYYERCGLIHAVFCTLKDGTEFGMAYEKGTNMFEVADKLLQKLKEKGLSIKNDN